MAKISDRLDRWDFTTGEPIIVSIRWCGKDSQATLDYSDRRFALVFYLDSGRGEVATIDGVPTTDASGPFFRFTRDGQFTENLRGQRVKIDLVERLLNGHETIATGGAYVKSGGAGIVSYGDMIGRVETRFTVYVDDNDVVVMPARQSQVRYQPNEAPPFFTTPASISSDGTPQVGEVLTGIDGVVMNGTVIGRQWLLNGVAISEATLNAFTPTQTGLHTFRVTALGTDGTETASSSSLTVLAANVPQPDPITITGIPPTTGTVGQPYSFTPTTANGAGAKVFSKNVTLLAGLTFSTTTGAITGTPTAPGTMTGLVVTVTDDTGSASTTAATVTIAAASTPGTVTVDPLVTRNGQQYTFTARRTGDVSQAVSRTMQVAASADYPPGSPASDWPNGSYATATANFAAGSPTAPFTITAPVAAQPE